jgi:hypothetical protein
MLTHELKDYVVYRDDRAPDRAYQCHRLTWAEWERTNQTKTLTVLVENVTMPEAWRLASLTHEEE